MTASNASTSRTTAGLRRLPGRRGAVVVAFAAAAALGLSSCSAGQISQTDTQVSAVTGSSVQSANGDITVNDVQLVLASEQALKDNNPFHLTFTASNANATVDYPLTGVAVDGDPVTLKRQPVNLCGNGSLTTLTPKELGQKASGAASTSAEGQPTAAAGGADGTAADSHGCIPLGAKTPAAADAPDPLEDLTTLPVEPITLDGTHLPGTHVEVTFTFEGVDPMTVRVPVTVPQHWDGERTDEH